AHARGTRVATGTVACTGLRGGGERGEIRPPVALDLGARPGERALEGSRRGGSLAVERCGGELRARGRAGPLVEQAEHGAAEQLRVARRGRELGLASLVHAPRDRGTQVGRLPGEVRGRALAQPRRAQVRAEAPDR